MTPEQQDLIRKASKSLEAAALLLSHGFPGFAVSRAYYSMFYIAQAFLEGEGLSYSKHSATIAGFGKHFVKKGLIPQKYHKYLIHAFEARQEGDYAPHELITPEAASELIQQAMEFLSLAEKMLRP
ncbi:MAG: HEPN domain-containing protein [bacterium]